MGRTCVRITVMVVAAMVVVAGLAAGVAVAQTPPAEGWVVLPVDEYRALRERTRPPAPPPISAVDATLTRVDYELRLENDAIVGRALLTADVLRDGWARVAVPAGLMAREARLDGQRVALVEGPPPYVLLSRAGRASVALDIAVPVTGAAGADTIILPASPSPISRVSLQLPRSGVDLTVTGGFVAERLEGDGESRWMVYGRPGQPITLSWKRKVDDRRAEQPLRIRARVTELVALGEESAQITASIRVEMQQGTLRDVTVQLPPGLAINQVNGATVADWNVTPAGLRVGLLEPTASDAQFVVQGEIRAPRDGEIVIPLVRVPLAERESGGVVVDVVGAGEIAGRQSRNLEPADPSELGDVISGRESPSMIAFRLRPAAGTEARALSVSVVRYTPQAVLIANVEEARYRAMVTEDGRALVEGRYAVRNNQRSFLKVTLPAGATLWSASLAGKPLRPGVAETGAVLLPLEKGRAGEEAPTFVVTVVFVQSTAAWPSRGLARIELPALDLPVSRTGVVLHYSPRYTVLSQPGAFRAETYSPPSAEALRARPTAPGATARPTFSGEQVADLPTARNSPTLLNLVPGVASFNAQTSSTDRTQGIQADIANAGSAGPSSGLFALAQGYTSSSSRTVIGAIPVEVTFPSVGPSLFLVSELTAEGRAGAVDLSIRRVR